MKKNILVLSLAMVLAFAFSFAFVGCKKDEVAAPAVTEDVKDEAAAPAEKPAEEKK